MTNIILYYVVLHKYAVFKFEYIFKCFIIFYDMYGFLKLELTENKIMLKKRGKYGKTRKS